MVLQTKEIPRTPAAPAPVRPRGKLSALTGLLRLPLPKLAQELAGDADQKTKELYNDIQSKMPGYARTTITLFRDCLKSFPKITCAAIGLNLADSVLKVAPLFLLAQLASSLVSQDKTSPTMTMLGLGVCWIASTLTNSFRGVINNRFQSKVKMLSEKQLFSAYLGKSLTTLGGTAFNEVANAAKISTYNTGYYLTGNLGIVGNFTTCLLAGAAIVSVTPVAGAAFAALGVAELWVALINVRHHTTVEQETSKASRIANSLGWNLMTRQRAQEYKSRGVCEREIERIQAQTAKVDDAHHNADKVTLPHSTLVGLAGDVIKISLLASVVASHIGSVNEIGAPLQVLLMAGAFTSALSSFVGGIASQVRNYLQIGKRLALPFIGDLERDPNKTYQRIDVTKSPTIEIKDLQYEAGGKSLLMAISAKFEPGKVYGLCGDSGAGKSTLMQLLTGVITPTSGNFLINGTSISESEIDDWRALFSYMPQDFLQCSGYSVGEAVVEFGAARLKTKPDINECFKLAEVNFIDPEKDLSVIIGGDFGGRDFSGGELQRLAIARAIIGEAKVLLLDEPTSKLGVIHDKQILANIVAKARATGQTVVIISHRYANLVGMDQVLYFENGKIVERGTHEELISKGGGYAARFQKEGEDYQTASN